MRSKIKFLDGTILIMNVNERPIDIFWGDLNKGIPYCLYIRNPSSKIRSLVELVDLPDKRHTYCIYEEKGEIV